jgi:hypothetical protein
MYSRIGAFSATEFLGTIFGIGIKTIATLGADRINISYAGHDLPFLSRADGCWRIVIRTYIYTVD